MKEIKCKIFVDDRQYVIDGPTNAAPWTVLYEDGLETKVLANGHFINYANLTEDDKSQMACLTFIEVCDNYDIVLFNTPTNLIIID